MSPITLVEELLSIVLVYSHHWEFEESALVDIVLKPPTTLFWVHFEFVLREFTPNSTGLGFEASSNATTLNS